MQCTVGFYLFTSSLGRRVFSSSTTHVFKHGETPPDFLRIAKEYLDQSVWKVDRTWRPCHLTYTII